ncbi:MAG: hypothetical protein AB1757_16755 [Acidobacteriota bacterium]
MRNIAKAGLLMMSVAILKEVSALLSLEQVMKWMLTRTPAAKLVNLIAQDEFTHDVIIRIEEKTFLVFDTT